MSIKIIASDLDGTLMSTDHMTVSPRTKAALAKAHEMGVKIAIATGRPLALIDYVVNQIPFIDYVITANGACVYDMVQKKNVYINLIENDTTMKLVDYFLSREVFFDVYIDGRSKYQLDTQKYFISTDFPQSFVDEVVKSMDGYESLSEFVGNQRVEKITLYSVSDSDYNEFRSEMESCGLSVATSFKGNLEATAGTAHKGSALKGLCELLGFTADEAMSFGDAGNDCPMLEFAKYSFAMENATEECKASAKYIAKSNGEDGVAQAIEKFVLNTEN